MKTNMLISILFLLCVQGVYSQDSIQPYQGVVHWQQTKDQRMEWFREARFGLFIHWGLYSAAAGIWDGKEYPQHYAEWIQTWAKVPSAAYAKILKPKFTAAKFDADAWAKLAKDAGMKYVVITSRHHEGFSIFNSQQPFSLKNEVTGSANISPKGRDLYGEIVTAFKKKGIKTGAYYSLLDWQHPDSYEGFTFNPSDRHTPNHEVYKEYLYGQVKELANNYGALDVLWVDFSSKDKQGETWGTTRILTDLIKWNPDIIINNRFWNGLENKNGDIGTPEKYIPPTGLPGMDWEVSHTMNESYGYSAHDENWKSTYKIMRLFIETVSKGGNFLLNIGPDGEGAIPPQAKKILSEVGEWMAVNSESIYGTTASPFGGLDWGYCTRKGNKLYLHVFDIPEDGRIRLPLKGSVKKVYPLVKPTEVLKLSSDLDGQVLSLPDPAGIRNNPMVLVVEVDGALEVIPSKAIARPDGHVVLDANKASFSGEGGLRLVGGSVQDNNRPNAIGDWTVVGDFVTWDINIRKPGDYDVFVEYKSDEKHAGDLLLQIGDGQLSFKLGNEKMTAFQQIKVGSLNIDQKFLGETEQKAILKAISISGRVPQISKVILTSKN